MKKNMLNDYFAFDCMLLKNEFIVFAVISFMIQLIMPFECFGAICLILFTVCIIFIFYKLTWRWSSKSLIEYIFSLPGRRLDAVFSASIVSVVFLLLQFFLVSLLFLSGIPHWFHSILKRANEGIADIYNVKDIIALSSFNMADITIYFLFEITVFFLLWNLVLWVGPGVRRIVISVFVYLIIILLLLDIISFSAELKYLSFFKILGGFLFSLIVFFLACLRFKRAGILY